MSKIANNSFDTNIKSVLKNRELRNKYTFRYNELGEGRWIMGDSILTDEEFDKLFPIEVKKINLKGQNCDSKNRWISD